MGYRKKVKMNPVEECIIILAAIIVVVSIPTVVIAGISKLLWAIYLKFRAFQHAKARKLCNVMETASLMPLQEAVMALRNAGIYYDFNAKWRGKHLRFPKCFWLSTELYFNPSLKARTLITIATSAMNDKSTEASKQIAYNMFESLVYQAAKTPARAIAVVGLMAQQIVGNAKLSVLSDQLDDIGTYSA